MKLILTADIDHLGASVTPSRSRTGTAVTSCSRAASRSSPRAAPRSRLTRSAGRAKPKTVRDLGHANEIKAAIEALSPFLVAGEDRVRLRQAVGSVTAGDVVAAVEKAGGPNLDKRIVRLPKTHIKAVGTHPVSVHLHPQVNVEFALDVVGES